jgi:hypothetical protein
MRRLYRLMPICVLGLVGGALQTARADTVTYYGYPAPGGNSYTTVSGSGASESGGITHQYGTFDPSAYSALYWTIDTVAEVPNIVQTGTALTDNLTFDASRSNLPAGVLVFDGTGQVDSAEFGLENYFGELVVSVTNPTNVALSLDSPAAHTGLPTADGGALNVTGPYNVNLQFLMGANSSSLTDAADYYNSLHAPQGDGLSTNVTGGFYYVAPVPLPSAAWLLLSGVVGLGVITRKRRVA